MSIVTDAVPKVGLCAVCLPFCSSNLVTDMDRLRQHAFDRGLVSTFTHAVLKVLFLLYIQWPDHLCAFG